MTTRTKAVLKGYFNTGDVPTEANFADLIDNMRYSYCPLDYGALGDGTTDDTVAVQSAIDAAEATGGIIDLAGRTYRITKQGNVAYTDTHVI